MTLAKIDLAMMGHCNDYLHVNHHDFRPQIFKNFDLELLGDDKKRLEKKIGE